MVKKVLMVIWMVLGSHYVTGQQDRKAMWVDSVFAHLKVREKIGQMLMLSVHVDGENEHTKSVLEDIRTYHPGGLYVTKGQPQKWVAFLNQAQAISKVPLLAATQAESGPGQSFAGLMQYPPPLALGAIQSDSLVTALASEISHSLGILGIQMNFAPNADINLNMDFAERYLGSDKKRVAHTAVTFAQGLQSSGTIACAKHSPFGNDVDVTSSAIDSTLLFRLNRLDTIEFYPYEKLIEGGVGALLTSHLHFSTREKRKAVPASVSQMFINQILRQQMGFKGLTITDIPYLQNVSGKTKGGETEALAFEIGNDLLINPQNLNQAVKHIQKLLKHNAALRDQLDASVKRILAAKYDAGLNNRPVINPDNLVRRINNPEAQVLKNKLVEASVTVLRNAHSFLPIQKLEDRSFMSLSVGRDASNAFVTSLSQYAPVEHHTWMEAADTSKLTSLFSSDVLFISLFPSTVSLKPLAHWVAQLPASTQVIVCDFGNHRELVDFQNATAIVTGYSSDTTVMKQVADLIFGTRQGNGALPYMISENFPIGTSSAIHPLDRLGYGLPEEVGMDRDVLDGIEDIAQEAIENGATPGCSIIVARKGKVIYQRSFGWQTYDRKIPVDNETIYDLASVTKVSATLQTVMFMYEHGMIDLYKKASVYLPELKDSNKKDFTIKDILTHQAGLWPYLPFWQQTMDESGLMPAYYGHVKNDDYPYPVADHLFAVKTMKDSLWRWIVNAKIREKPGRTPFDYRYSDMGFYIMQHLAEKELNQPIQDFMDQNFYEPLGAYTTGYLPLRRFPPSRIAPTENDTTFRKSQLIGYVHDQGAAMHGGIAGHAGLFSDANDLAKLAQMWLQKGSYGGLRYFKPETIELFTQQQYETSRRGLGWDKPTQAYYNGPTTILASPQTFGHTGFTGTCVWVDPVFDLVYVFLSNRVYPDMTNGKLLSGNIRPRIQELIYRSIFAHCQYEKGDNNETKAQ